MTNKKNYASPVLNELEIAIGRGLLSGSFESTGQDFTEVPFEGFEE